MLILAAALVAIAAVRMSTLAGAEAMGVISWLFPATTPVTFGTAATGANGLVPATVTWVSDGDTLRVELGGASERIRMLGIDAPESVAYDAAANSEQGRCAAEHTRGLVHAGDIVWLQSEADVDRDRYGRLLRWVWLQEPSCPISEDEVRSKMLDAIVLRDGYARTFWLDGTYASLFERLEDEARTSGAGLWATGGDWGRSYGG